jgi:hypothetical protein
MPEEPLEGADLEFGEAIASVMGAHELPKIAGSPSGTPAESNPTPVSKTAETEEEEDPLATILGMDYEDLFKHASFRKGVSDELEASKHEWEPLLVDYYAALTGQNQG